jgi:hypothetical protein
MIVVHSIPLEALFMEGNLPSMPYIVILLNKTYCGEIKVGLAFTGKTILIVGR